MQTNLKRCRDLFDIVDIPHPRIPHLNFFFKRKHRFDGDTGYGIYFFCYKLRLLYVGSYCGQKNGIAHVRWWTHLASITSRFRETNYLKLKGKQFGTTSFLYKSGDKQRLNDALEHQRTKLETELQPVFSNDDYKSDIYEPLLGITSEDPKYVVKNIAGDGACGTSIERIKTANNYWHVFRDLNLENILDDFSFLYVRVEPDEEAYPDLAAFLYSNDINSRLRKTFFRRYVEDWIICSLDAPANSIKAPRNFAGDVDDKVIEQGKGFIHDCMNQFNKHSFTHEKITP